METKPITDRECKNYVRAVSEAVGLPRGLLSYLAIREWLVKHGERGLKRALGLDGKMWIGTLVDLDEAKRY